MEQKQQIVNRLNNEYFLLPEGLKNAGFKNYKETNKITTRAKEETIKFTTKFLKPNEDKYNLLIIGNPGTGKSHLGAAIARTVKERGLSVGFLTTGQLLAKIKGTYKKGSLKSEEGIFQDLKMLDLLVLDDVGSEANSGINDWRKSMLFEIVESRSGKPTIYTSNFSDIDLPIAVGERVLSRLYYNTKFIDLFTDDYRKNSKYYN